MKDFKDKNDIKMSKEELNERSTHTHTHGELSDEELENVAGGMRGSNGLVIVTSGLKCFTGCYEHHKGNGLWYFFSSDGCCGRCNHLAIDGGTGYCLKSK